MTPRVLGGGQMYRGHPSSARRLVTATDEVDGLLVCGVYGTGKSSVAAEIAETLERRGVPYGALDLDWLAWFDVPGMDRHAARDVYLDNVASVIRNYRAIGVRHVVMAGSVRDRDEVRALATAAAIPLPRRATRGAAGGDHPPAAARPDERSTR